MTTHTRHMTQRRADVVREGTIGHKLTRRSVEKILSAADLEDCAADYKLALVRQKYARIRSVM